MRIFLNLKVRVTRTVLLHSQREQKIFPQLIRLCSTTRTTFPPASPKMDLSFDHLPIRGSVNYHKSLEIDLSKQESKEFEDMSRDRDTESVKEGLKKCLEESEKHSLQGAWLKIPVAFAWTLQSAVDAGFEMHHAQKEHVMMSKWLNKDRVDSHPIYAHHFIGVGGIVVNEKDEVLCIREKYVGDLKHAYSQLWKLPGGHVDPGEYLGTAVEREVSEETNIKATFKGLLAFRHMHQFRYGCSDMYFCCLLSAEDTDNQTIKISEYEVHECKWVPISDFEQLNLSELNRLFFKQYLQYRKTGVFMNFTYNQNVRRKTTDIVYYSDPGGSGSADQDVE